MPPVISTLTQLLTVATPVQNLSNLLTILGSPAVNFPNTTNWTTGTVPNALLQTIGWGFTDIQQSRFNFAAGGLLDYAVLVKDNNGDTPWLTLHADQVFNNQIFPAVAAEVDETFTDSAGQGPFTIGPGGAGVSVGPGQVIYRTTNTVNVTLPLNGSVTIRVRAPTPGSQGNIPDGSLRFFASGTLPGVTVTNGPGSLKIAGIDQESATSLQLRCRTKWPLLSTGSQVQAYVNWALFSGQGQVGKVKPKVNTDLTDPGLVKLYLGSPAGGGVSGAIVTAVQNFIAPITLTGERSGSRIPETAKCIVASATPITIYIRATILVYSPYDTPTFLAQVFSDIAAYQAAFPIGGLSGPLSSFIGSYVSYSRIFQLLLNRSGVFLTPAQEVAANDLELSYDGITWFILQDLPIADTAAVTFDVSNITVQAIPSLS